MAGSLKRLFPPESRQFWQQVFDKEEQIWEIRLRAGKPVILHGIWGERFLDGEGNITEEQTIAHCMETEGITTILQHICHYSPYAFEEELRQGFLSVAGGHRVGVTGQIVAEGSSVKTIKHISGLNIRIAHQIKGAADAALPWVYRNGEVQNTLIISPPGCGKTTLLRDLIRQVSDGNLFGSGRSVGVVDERSELAGCFQGIPQNDLGIRTDVLDACPKAIGMMMLLRSMAPRVIAVDEIGGKEDAEALYAAACSGSGLLATIHGTCAEEIMQKEGMKRLFREGIFQCFLVLSRADGVPCIRKVEPQVIAEEAG